MANNSEILTGGYRKPVMPDSLGSLGRSGCRMSAGDAEGGDRIEVAQLLRGEAVAGTVPAGHVEAQGQDGHGGGARVWHVEVAGCHAVRDDVAEDLADLALLGRDLG
jgi:hypothetical protein